MDINGVLNSVFDSTNNALRVSSDGGGGGAVEVISRLVASGGATASFDFTSIAGTYESLRLVVMGRGTTAAGFIGVRVRFNNDSSAIYDGLTSYATGPGGSNSLASETAQTSALAGSITAASATAAMAGITEILIPAYARTVYQKTLMGLSARFGTNTTDYVNERVSARWRSTAAITRVTVLPASDNFADDSVCTLYGIKGA